MAAHRFYIGTYTKTGSKGIYTLTLDAATGALSAPEVAAEAGNPTYLALSPDRKFLYAVADTEALAAAFAVEPGGRLRRLPAPATPTSGAPCYVAVERTRRTLVVAHYHQGFLASLPIQPDGSLGAPRIVRHSGKGVDPVRQAGAHAHSTVVSPDNRFVLCCDLGLDRIFSYRLDAAHAGLSEAEVPFVATDPGAGPRHLAFAPGGARAYVANELANTVTGYAYDAARGSLSPFQTLSSLPAGFSGKNTAAEIAVHPGGRFLIASNRGHDSLAVFAVDPASGKLSPPVLTLAGGRTPRGFALSPDGGWVLCSHQDSGTLASFRFDAATGRLSPAGGPVAVPTPVGVLAYD